MTVDSLQLAIENPSKFIFPTKSCKDKEEKYFIEANNPPRIQENTTAIQFLKDNLNVKRDIRKKYEDKITLEIFVDEKGIIEKIRYADNWLDSKKMKMKYGRRIIHLLKNESPWIPAHHQNKNISMKLTLEVKIEDLIKK